MAQSPAPSPAPAANPKPAASGPLDRDFTLIADIDLQQDWAKDDPKHPGPQWSKSTGHQHYEIRTRLRSEGKLEVRNFLDLDQDVRLKAKTIYLARQAKKQLEANGKPFVLPTTPAGRHALDLRMQDDYNACNAQPACVQAAQLRYAAIYAAMQYPEALQEDKEPGVFYYYLPYPGCPGHSRVVMSLSTEGVRFNKTSDRFVPFSEKHSADTVDWSDGLQLCDHYAATIDIEDKVKPMYQETIYIPSMSGITEYTESGHTSREEQSQIFPTEVLDWIGIYLRQAPVSGAVETTIPLTLPLNGNATPLGRWTGTGHLKLRWDFREVPTQPMQPAAAPAPKK